MTKIRESEGGGYERRGKFYVRVTVGAQDRMSELAPWATSLPEVQERGRVLQGFVNRLRRAGQTDFVRKVVELGAKADEAKLATLAEKVTAIVGNDFERVEEPAAKDTFGDLADRWTSGTLARQFPDHDLEKAASSVKSDEDRLNTYVLPHLRDVPLRSFTRAHADFCMSQLPAVSRATGRPLLPGSRRQIGQVIARVLNLAEFAGIIERSPLPKGWLPKGTKPDSVAKESLLPSEEAKLYAGRDGEGRVVVPLVFRVLYAFDHREGMRKGEAQAFDWRDLNLAKGIVSLDENKTDRPRSWVLTPGVLRMLEVWHEMQGKPKAGLVFAGIRDGQWQPLAGIYREHAKAVGIDRARLFERKIGKKLKLRAHDMRAFFITASMYEGRDMLWITDRSGHTTLSQLNRYKRDLRLWRELGEQLVDVAEALPEIAACRRVSDDKRGGRSGGSDNSTNDSAALRVKNDRHTIAIATRRVTGYPARARLDTVDGLQGTLRWAVSEASGCSSGSSSWQVAPARRTMSSCLRRLGLR